MLLRHPLRPPYRPQPRGTRTSCPLCRSSGPQTTPAATLNGQPDEPPTPHGRGTIRLATIRLSWRPGGFSHPGSSLLSHKGDLQCLNADLHRLDVSLHRRDVSLQCHDVSLHRLNAGLQCVNVGLHPLDASLQRHDVSLQYLNVNLQYREASLQSKVSQTQSSIGNRRYPGRLRPRQAQRQVPDQDTAFFRYPLLLYLQKSSGCQTLIDGLIRSQQISLRPPRSTSPRLTTAPS